MSENIPENITRDHVLAAIADIQAGVPHSFADSTKYNLIYDDICYPPKAVLGVAASKATLNQREYNPYDFKGGEGSKCFRILRSLGFKILPKYCFVYSDEIPESNYIEGAGKKFVVNKYERDPRAREECVRFYGAKCQVCGIQFHETYGEIGGGFIHVHHNVPLSTIGQEYQVNPIEDLIPVCPNCHAMLHMRTPPLTVGELRNVYRMEG